MLFFDFFNTTRRKKSYVYFLRQALSIYPFIILSSSSLSSSLSPYCATQTFYVPELYYTRHHIIHTTSALIQWANCTVVLCENKGTTHFLYGIAKKYAKKAKLELVIDTSTLIFISHGSFWVSW